MASTGLSARRGPKRDAFASCEDRNNAERPVEATSGRLLFVSGGVEVLARCEGIVTANLSWPETKIEPILWAPIVDPWYDTEVGLATRSGRTHILGNER